MHAHDLAQLVVRASLTRLIALATLLLPILLAACGDDGGGAGPAY